MSDVIEQPVPDLAGKIFQVRAHRVLLDESLAALYGTSTKALNQAVRRNRERFPEDFLIELSQKEWESLRTRFASVDVGWGRHRKYPPLAFTEHGAIMAAMILNSTRAVQMSVYVVRAFVKLREELASNSKLSRRLETLERSVAALDADMRKQFDQVYEAILGLMGTEKQRRS